MLNTMCLEMFNLCVLCLYVSNKIESTVWKSFELLKGEKGQCTIFKTSSIQLHLDILNFLNLWFLL